MAPMMSSAATFDGDSRTEAHHRLVKGVERAYNLVQASVDQA